MGQCYKVYRRAFRATIIVEASIASDGFRESSAGSSTANIAFDDFRNVIISLHKDPEYAKGIGQ